MRSVVVDATWRDTCSSVCLRIEVIDVLKDLAGSEAALFATLLTLAAATHIGEIVSRSRSRDIWDRDCVGDIFVLEVVELELFFELFFRVVV